MEKTQSNPERVAPPFARYSHATRVDFGGGALVFVSGQLSVDVNRDVVGEGDAAVQAKQVFTNIAEVLEAHGATMRDVVSTNTYLADIDDLAAVNEVRARHSPDDPPTSTTVQVGALARPAFLVEIEAVAALATSP